MSADTVTNLADLESVACNLCGGQRTRSFQRKSGFEVVACEACGLVYVNPRPGRAALNAHYNGNESSRIQYYLDAEPADRKSFAIVLERLERLRPGVGALLDVGTNVGTCLVVARERGWGVSGIELNARAAEHCRTSRSLDVRSGTLDERPFPPASFDAVTLGDVIEHLLDPLQALVRVRELLKPGGLVAISTPDIAGWAGRALQVKPEEHLYYFSPRTMTALLDKAGFETLEVCAYDRYKNLTGMTHSTTFGTLFQRLGPLLRTARRVLGDVVVRLPIRENLLAIARARVAVGPGA